ncbi:MAG: hypothetical protein LUF04_07095 [Bacteroides sp.]|nr:hypothetical protein [Bacteroides sp.]
MTQEFTIEQLVKPETLLTACTSLLDGTPNKVKTLLYELTRKEAAATEAIQEKGWTEDLPPEKRVRYSPFEVDLIEEYFEGVDISEGATKWIILIKDTHIECLFSKTPTGTYGCVRVHLKFIHRNEFERVYKYLATQGTAVSKEDDIRRFLIRKYNLAAYETWIYRTDVEVKIIVQPEYIKDMADKYTICFQRTGTPADIPYASVDPGENHSPIDPESVTHLAFAVLNLSIEQIREYFCSLGKTDTAFAGCKAKKYTQDADTANEVITWLFILPGFRIECVFPNEQKGRCDAVILHFNSREDLRNTREYIGSNGTPHEQRPVDQRRIIEQYDFPRYEHWLYGRDLLIYVVEQPRSLTDKFYIHFRRK